MSIMQTPRAKHVTVPSLSVISLNCGERQTLLSVLRVDTLRNCPHTLFTYITRSRASHQIIVIVLYRMPRHVGNKPHSRAPPAALESCHYARGVRTRKGRLPKVPKGPKEVLKRVYLSTWEKNEPRIDEIYEDVGGWKGRVTWGDSKVNEYPVTTLYIRCPQKVGHAILDRGLSTNFTQVFSYYERELCRLRAERTNAGGLTRDQVHEWTSESSTPQTPAIALQPPQRWKAPEADMYGHSNAKSFYGTDSE